MATKEQEGFAAMVKVTPNALHYPNAFVEKAWVADV